MKLGFYLTGAFGQSKALYDVGNDYKRGRGPFEAVIAQILADTKTVINAQRQAGAAFVIDPMFRFYYLLQPFAERLPLDSIKDPEFRRILEEQFQQQFGVGEGPQENWFNNNVFYRRPKIGKSLDTTSTGWTLSYIHPELLPKDGTAMVVLPSPYTLMALSKFGNVSGYELPHESQRSAIMDIAQLIRAEAESLVRRGFGRIQYDEPAIVHRQSLGELTQQDLLLLELAMQKCGRIEGATTVLHTYFGDAGPILERLRDLEVDGIGIDMTETKLEDILRHKFDGKGKELVLGMINARTSAAAQPQVLVDRLRRVADATKPKAIYVTPNTGTEYIGWTAGFKKLETMQAVREGFEK